MAAIASLSDLVNRATGGNSGTPENIFIHKLTTVQGGSSVTWTTGVPHLTWRYDGFPSAGATPTTVAAPTSATTGAIPFTNATGGRDKWLTQFAMSCTSNDTISWWMLYDRLLHIGGLDGTVTSAQTVGGTITRNTGGLGNRIWVPIYSLVGTGARTITASYTNENGTSGRTSGSAQIGGSAGQYGNEEEGFVELPLQAGDKGVQSVQSVTISSSTGTAGDFGVIIARPLLFVPAMYGVAVYHDPMNGTNVIPQIDDDACLSMAFGMSTTAEAMQVGMLATVEA